MAKSFKHLRDKMPLDSQAAASNKAKALMAEMPLSELRLARKLSQAQLAEKMHVNQAAISKMERRTDMYVSTLREAIKAMGGELEIQAKFPDGSVSITQFHDIRGNSGS
ncbi:XRE family transcriptional regulator [Spongiibacter sp. KMU-158]|uniref:XRE family transcriptional regulator n=2 Tax=Spongiibacter pelagi TaxID=2760804 RepID=A0A927C305_9GAMM|nr:XRE family transcriptional regulator [Spongiibacter pelagi]